MSSISVVPSRYLNYPKSILLAAFFLIIAIIVNGQPAIPSLHRNVDLPAGNLRFDLLLHLITQQTGIKFSLNTQKFRPSRIMHVRNGIQSVDELLSTIKSSTGIHYTFLGDHIIFIDKPPPNTAPAAKKGADPLSSHVLTPVLEDYSQIYLSRASFDSNKSYRSIPDRFHGLSMVKKDLVRTDSNVVTRTTRRRSPSRPVFVAGAGLISDETFYINPSIRAGWPFLYGIVQWSTDLNVSGFRYGAGGSLGLSDKWRLGLMATTGVNSKTYPPILTGVPRIPLIIRSSLQKAGLLAETTIGRNIQLQFGPVLNLLSTKYYNLLGVPTPPFLSESDANSQYRYIKPIYTLDDDYGQLKDQNTKIWIGFQAGLFYLLPFRRSR